MNSYIKNLILSLSIVVCSLNTIKAEKSEYNFDNWEHCINEVKENFDIIKMSKMESDNPEITEYQTKYIQQLAKAADISAVLLKQHVDAVGGNISSDHYASILIDTSFNDLRLTLSQCLSIEFNRYSKNNEDLFLNKIKQCYNEEKITPNQYKALLEFLLYTAAHNNATNEQVMINKSFSTNLIKDYILLLKNSFNLTINDINEVIQSITSYIVLASYFDNCFKEGFVEDYNISNYHGNKEVLQFKFNETDHSISNDEIDRKLNISELFYEVFNTDNQLISANKNI